MKQSNSSHFHHGKAARARSEACIAPADGRMTPESRQQWYDGWNLQDSLMKPVPSDAEIADTASFLKTLKQTLSQ